ncbi:tail fiber domain-containing protein [Aeromonas veronii]|uniref:phage tail fiber protein n=3 Tax=Aeromonas veronii TaxID=654 RepID=UPI0038E73BB3
MTTPTITELYAQIGAMMANWQRFLDQQMGWQAGPSSANDLSPPDNNPANKGYRVMIDATGNKRQIMTPSQMEKIVADAVKKIDDLKPSELSAQLMGVRADVKEITATLSSSRAELTALSDNATSSKNSAASSATAASSSKTAAASSATAAASSATAAASSATAASSSKTAAAESQGVATAKAAESKASATEAANKASDATLSASTASTKAAEAVASATTASTKADEASSSATSAASSATAAAGSATAAAGSATAAKTSETNAGTKASAAATSATSAQKWADNAVDSAVTTGKFSALHHATKASESAAAAAASANTSLTKASEASGHASNASNSASAATAKASEAATGASTATAKANAAASSATAAAGSATAASNSATAAANSASSAANSATAASSSKTAAASSAEEAAASAKAAREAMYVSTGALIEAGDIDMSSGTYPAPLKDASGKNLACFWKVTKAGIAKVDGVDYEIGDTLVYSSASSKFYKIDNTESVLSVNGMKGPVVLTAAHVGALGATATAVAAARLATARLISITGDGEGSASFDGTGNVSINLTVTDDSHAHTFANLKNRPTTLSGYGITDAAAAGHTHDDLFQKSGGVITGLTQVNIASGPTIGGTTFDNGWLRVGTSAGGIAIDPNEIAVSGNDLSFGTITNNIVSLVVNNTRIGEMKSDGLYSMGSKVLTALEGSAVSAGKLSTARALSLTGDATGSMNFDGSANASMAVTLANSGVTAGTFTKVTVDAKGRVTAASTQTAADIPNLDWSKITSGKPTTLTGYGVSSATLKAMESLTMAADKAPYFTAAGTAASMTVTEAARALLDDADAAAMRATLGVPDKSAATTSVNGLMSASDKAKLDGIGAGANKYVHPSGDGNLHVPATGTTSNGKYLKAGSAAGDLMWSPLAASDVGLELVNNWPATSSPTDGSASKYATAQAVKTVNDIAENAARLLKGTRRLFTVGGDPDTYYMVLIKPMTSDFGDGRVMISRGYNWAGPNTWNNATHRAGLTFAFRWSGDSAWGGNSKLWVVDHFNESYASTLGQVKYLKAGFAVWLRGGNAQYCLQSDYGVDTAFEVYLNDFTDSDKVVYSPIATPNLADVLLHYSLRNGAVYDNDQRVYSPVNKPKAADVGLDLVNNWGFSTSISEPSDTLYATAGAVKRVADIASAALPKSGGILTGSVTFSNDSVLQWSRNTDAAAIGFKNSSDSDTDSFMWFRTSDNGNEYFKWQSVNGATTTDLMTLKGDNLRIKGYQVYHQDFKPTAAELGVLSSSGGELSGSVIMKGEGSGITFAGLNNGTGIYSGTKDAASKEGCNLQIKSWYGIGIAPSAGSTLPEGENSIWINARNGNINSVGDFYAKTDKRVFHEGFKQADLPVNDVRGTERAPSFFAPRSITAWFNQTGMPSSVWYSGLTVKGWDNNYNSWQLFSNSNTGASDNKLYFRTGNVDAWNATARVFTTLDLPTASDVGLSNLNNWAASTSTTDASANKYATASAVKAAADIARAALPVSGGVMNGPLVGPTFTARNENNVNATVNLTFMNDVPALRYGGSGAGSGSGFIFAGIGDAVKLKIDESGELFAKGTAKVFHADNLPTLAALGAASAGHTHTYYLRDIKDSPYKEGCDCATTANLPSAYANGSSGVGATLTNNATLAALAIDGVNCTVGMRVLVKNQTAAAQNGIYTVTRVGSASEAWVLTRTPGCDTSAETAGAVVTVDQGTVNGGLLMTTEFKRNGVIGTTAMNWRVVVDAGNIGAQHHASGVAAGTYRSVTVNAQGHVTGGTNPTTLAGYGITDALGANSNAVSATKLATARQINGTNFDGSANITTANWGSSRKLTIGGAEKTVNGSADVSWSLAEIGAVASVPLRLGSVTAGKMQSCRLLAIGKTDSSCTFMISAQGDFGNRSRGWYQISVATRGGAISVDAYSFNAKSSSDPLKLYTVDTGTVFEVWGEFSDYNTDSSVIVCVSQGATFYADQVTTGKDWATFTAAAINKFYTSNDKPTAEDVGLSNLNNWSASSATNLASDETYATASAVKKAYDLAAAALPSGSNAASATKLATSRTISTTGDATGSASFDGTANAAIALTLANSGVAAGTYTKVTVDAKGRVTSGSAMVAADIPNLDWSKITSGKPTTLAGYGITDAQAKHANLTALAGVSPAADRIPYFTSGTAASVTALTAFARSLLDDNDAAAARATLGVLSIEEPFKSAADVATTANLDATYANGSSGAGATLTSKAMAALSLDGVTVTVGMRVLVKNQNAPAENGIYTMTTAGSTTVAWVLTRATDADTSAKLAGAVVTVDQGAANGSLLLTNDWKKTSVVGTTAMNWRVVLDSGNVGAYHHNSGATAGTYRSVTVNAQGHVTAGSNPTTLSGYGITDAAPSSHVGSGGGAHSVATASVNGFMSGADKAKLDSIASNANNYSHPAGDGNLHVPATGTGNNGKFLMAGATAGSVSWQAIDAAKVGAVPVAGGAMSGVLTVNNEIRTTSANSLRMVQGNYGSFWRQDGSNVYLMFTNAGDQNGSYNGLRPMYANLANGNVNFGHAVDIGGNLYVNTSSTSWLDMRSSVAIQGRAAVNTSSASAIVRQEHADRHFVLGGLGNSQFGIYMINKNRTANGTDAGAYLSADGTWYCGGNVSANDYQVRSDRRLKSDFKEIKDTWDLWKTLQISEYTKEGAREYGFIAQDFEKGHKPAIAKTMTDDYLNLKPMSVLAIAGKVIQSLQERVENLENMLKARLEVLDASTS